MADPTPVNVSGQGGSITIGGVTFNVRNWMISKKHTNADTTTTGSKGWKERVRVISEWYFVAEMPWDSAHPGDVPVVTAGSGAVVPAGIESPTPAECQFKLGASDKKYHGKALAEAVAAKLDAAGNVVGFQMAGEGTGPLYGPD